jgi:hypothetical protein
VEIGLGKVVQCQTALKQGHMSQADMAFLVSFFKLMRPLVKAMKLLEDENNDCYIGNLITQ